ncbi:ATP-grasp domain-containing protein [Haloechinothrix halophila]|uniref:ATP-grasp domain-containing protein n=1 Tax=Haloechinothrix halophila TaxID=1069073 RepID=UPI00040BED2A|nr:ATP-grasp domain-containing protein [Haloechinothrix halophila]
MSNAGTLLLIGGNDETVVKAKRLGLRVLLVQHPSTLTAAQYEHADVVRVLDYTDWAQLEPAARELAASQGFSVAMSLTEPGLDGAGRVNDLFGLGGTGQVVTERFRDKYAMRRYLAGVDPDAVPAAPLETARDLADFAAAHGYPFIVKPVDATASIGVHRVDGPEDADRVWATVRRLRGTRTDRISTLFVLRDFMMEGYVSGPEFSVETASFGGRHVVIAITEKFTDDTHFAELGHALPARLDTDTEERIRAGVSRFLTLMGLRDGVAHTEVRLSAFGPQVIESHNRLGGDAISELIYGAFGIDMVTLAVGWPFGLVPELPDRPVPHAGASTRFIVGDPGTVTSVAGTEEATRADDVLDVRLTAKPGDEVRTLRDNWDRLGLVAVTGADTTAAVARGARLIGDHIRIAVDTGDGETSFARVAELPQRTAALS